MEIKENTKRALFLIALSLVLFTLIAPISSAFSVDPGAVWGAMRYKLGAINEWYDVVSYETTEKGIKFPVLNEEHSLERRIVDFIFVWVALSFALLKNKTMKDRFGRRTLIFLTGILAFIFAASYKVGLFGGLFPLITNAPFIIFMIVVYLLISWPLKKAHPFFKLLALMFALAITLYAFNLYNDFTIDTPQLRGFGKIPLPSWFGGSSSSGYSEPKYVTARYVAPSTETASNATRYTGTTGATGSGASGNWPARLEQAAANRVEAEELYRQAEELYNTGRYQEAMEAINKAQQINRGERERLART